MKTSEVAKRIIKDFNENKNSHVFLMDTNNSEKCKNDVKSIIEEVIKADKIVKNQIENETYLELVVLNTEDKEYKKDDILYLQTRIKTKPILAKYIFYIIAEGHKLNDITSNKLLKTIEEPNENVIGFIITENIDVILPTIKSRCQIEKMIYENSSNKHSEENIEKRTVEMIEVIEKKDLLDFNIYKKEIKDLKECGKEIAKHIKDYYNTACNIEKSNELNDDILKLIIDNNSKKALVAKAKILNKMLDKLTNNANASIILEKICIELKDVSK